MPQRTKSKSSAEPAPATDDKGPPAEPAIPPKSPDQDTAPADTIKALLSLDADSASDHDIRAFVEGHLRRVIAKHEIATQYRLLFLYDSVAIGRTDADRIYEAISTAAEAKPVLLIINSPGGDVASAYLISKLCREHADGNFEIAVPRQAKSAATLIACGADHIHMGSLSELGPIDPQFGQIPALALKNSVEHLATLAQVYPQAAEMFASYLSRSLRVEALGYYERVAESATQYAIRLLEKRINRGERAATDIAHTLVYEYKDHGFVIDATEAEKIFGEGVILVNTAEYQLANDTYNSLKFLEWIIDWKFSRTLAFTGGAENGCMMRRRSE